MPLSQLAGHCLRSSYTTCQPTLSPMVPPDRVRSHIPTDQSGDSHLCLVSVGRSSGVLQGALGSSISGLVSMVYAVGDFG